MAFYSISCPMKISQKTESMERVSSNLILKTRKRFISAWTKETNTVSICCSSFTSTLQYYKGEILNSFCCIHCQVLSVLHSIPCYKKLEINTAFSRPNARLGEWGWGEPFGGSGREPLAGLQGMTLATFFPFFL